MDCPKSQRSDSPFPHVVIDDFVSPELCLAACVEWPASTWPHWLKYSGERGDKFASHDAARLTPACRLIVDLMAQQRIAELIDVCGAFPDLSLYGAGMSMIRAGGELPLHLDSDHHPVTGWERAASAMIYLSPCEGGEFQLWSGGGERIEKQIAPRPGRLVLFACSDASWHSVAPVDAGDRLSLSLFSWRLPTGGAARKRPRAQFAPG